MQRGVIIGLVGDNIGRINRRVGNEEVSELDRDISQHFLTVLLAILIPSECDNGEVVLRRHAIQLHAGAGAQQVRLLEGNGSERALEGRRRQVFHGFDQFVFHVNRISLSFLSDLVLPIAVRQAEVALPQLIIAFKFWLLTVRN